MGMMRSRKARSTQSYECPFGCCRMYSKHDRKRKHLDKMYRVRENHQWKKENL